MRLRPRGFSVLSTAAICIVSLVVALLAAELGLRFVSGEQVELHGMFAGDDVAGVRLAPGFQGAMRTSEFEYHVSINDLGMRDHAVAPKPAEGRRVLVIGDSFVFGVGVELDDSLPKSLERLMRRENGSGPLEVFNAGVPGYGTFQELQTLRRLAPIVEPDLVVWVFFVGDDWYGNTPRGRHEPAEQGFWERLRTHSTVLRTVDRVVVGFLKGKDHYEIHRVEPTADVLARMDDVLGLLEQARDVAASRGAKFLVALCPRYTQVYDGAWSSASVIYRLSDEYAPSQPNDLFMEKLGARGFWHVDLLGPMRTEGRVRDLHFNLDGHWNRSGNEFAARILTTELAKWLHHES